MTPKNQAESFIEQALYNGFSSDEAIEVAKFAVDKIINYCELDNINENFWFEVMNELESR